jgi:transcriptional regulator with XRE-family HTH domain
MDSAPRTHDAGDPDDSTYEATQQLVREELRRARKVKGWSQSQLGDAIGLSRFTIIKFESGKQEMTVEVAQRVETALGTEGLVALVDKRESLADRGERRYDRDTVVRRLLRTPNLQRVRIVLADDLDVHGLIAGNPALVNARVQVFVPTAARERQLFRGQPIYGHLENQIKMLSELADDWGDRVRGSLDIYESAAVLGPTVLARSPSAIECAYWPVLSSGPLIDGRDMQASSTLDPRMIGRVEAHLEEIQAAASKIQRNEALAVVDPQPRPKGENRPIEFTRFEAVGDHEDLGADEAVTVALVLIHTICPRRDLGIKRRILVHSWSEDPDLWSLPGHAVEEVDVRRARLTADRGDYVDPPRSTKDPLDASLEHEPYFRRFGGEIPIEVFKQAASRGIFRDFGIEVEVCRLDNVVLPPALQRIAKERPDSDHAAVVRRLVPRLFTLELKEVPGNPSLQELSELKKRANVKEWGYQDLLEHEDLNDFLTDAKQDDFLINLCRDLGVAAR